jgi:hypothetical protein
MDLAIIIGITLIMLGVILVIYAITNPSDPDEDLDNSNGTADAAANRALETTNNRIRRGTARAHDYFRRGRIRQLNILQNNIRDPDTVNELAIDYNDALDRTEGPDLLTNIIIAGVAQFIDLQPHRNTHTHGLHNLQHTLNHVNVQTAEQRVKNAEAATENRLDAVTLAMTQAATARSDSQNVHDSSVNNNLKSTIKTLQNSRGDFSTQEQNRSIDELSRYVYSKDNSKASQVLDIMKNGQTVHTFGINEREILSLAWERTKHPDNAHVKTSLQEAFVDALADAVEHGEPVCPNGRSARVLGSGVTIDVNPSIGALHTAQDIRREIFNDIKKMFDEKIAAASIQTSDNDLKQLGLNYLGQSDEEINPETERKLHEELKLEVKNIIERHPDLTVTDRKRTQDEAEIYLGIE